VAVGTVVRNDVDDAADAHGIQPRDQFVEVGESSEPRVDGPIVVDIVAAVGQRRRVERAQPDGIHPQFVQVGNPRGDSRKVPEAVAVGVRERSRVDLVDGGVAPPVLVGGGGEVCEGEGVRHCGEDSCSGIENGVLPSL